MFLCLSLCTYLRKKKGKRETARSDFYNSFSTVSAMFTWLGLVNAVEGSKSEIGPTLFASCGAEAPLFIVITSLYWTTLQVGQSVDAVTTCIDSVTMATPIRIAMTFCLGSKTLPPVPFRGAIGILSAFSLTQYK
jgi:hypothetical protein